MLHCWPGWPTVFGWQAGCQPAGRRQSRHKVVSIVSALDEAAVLQLLQVQ
jgi:hypothetical protein